MAATSAIVADFSSADWTKTNATPHWQDPTRVSFDAAVQNNGVRTTVGYDLTNSSFSYKNQVLPGRNLNFEMRAANGATTVFRVIGNASDTGTFAITNGTTTGVATMTNAQGKANPYWRWSHSGTTMTFDAAADAAFTSIGFTTSFTPAIAITNLFIYIYQNQSGTAGTSGLWVAEEVNGASVPNIQGPMLADIGAIVESVATPTTVVPPVTTQTGDRMLMHVVNRPNTVTPTTPSGWTLVHTAAVGAAVAEGAGVGPVRLSVYQRDATSNAEASVSLVVTGLTAVVAGISAWRKDSTETWAQADGGIRSITTAATAWSAASVNTIASQQYDVIVATTALSDDTNQSAQGFSGTGLTFSNLRELADVASANGNDEALAVSAGDISAGSGTVAITHTATIAAAEYGGTSFIRLRTVAAPSAARIKSVTNVNRPAVVRASTW